MPDIKEGKFRDSSRHSGISLVELMLSVTVLACTMIPVAGIMGYGAAGTARDQTQIRAIQLCQERLNQSMAVPWTYLPPPGAAVTTNISSGTELIVPLGNITIGRTVFTVSLQTTSMGLAYQYYSVLVNDPAYTDPESGNYPWDLTSGAAGVQTLALANYARRVEVFVTWMEKGQQQTVRLATFRARLDR